MNERELKLKEQRAIKAQQILNDELVKSAFNDIRNHLVEKITKSSFKQQEDREDCYRMLRCLESFQGMFDRHIRDGVIAKDKLSMRVVKRIQEL